MSTAGKLQRASAGKIKRGTDGKFRMNTASIDTCCCDPVVCPCGFCTTSPSRFNLTVSGITACASCQAVGAFGYNKPQGDPNTTYELVQGSLGDVHGFGSCCEWYYYNDDEPNPIPFYHQRYTNAICTLGLSDSSTAVAHLRKTSATNFRLDIRSNTNGNQIGLWFRADLTTTSNDCNSGVFNFTNSIVSGDCGTITAFPESWARIAYGGSATVEAA
jgi:hypothetical protein